MPGDPLEIDAVLVEDSVLLAMDLADVATKKRYRRERERVYILEDLEERERSFEELARRWFQGLSLATPLLKVLEEFDSIRGHVSRIAVLRAERAKDEGADLHDSRAAEKPALLIHLTAPSLVNFSRVETLLRRELLHVEDMLDPDFGYERDLPALDGGATYEKLLRDRYRVIWDASVDGRLVRRGVLSKTAEAIRRQEFATAFPQLEEKDASFESFFRGPRPRHREILKFTFEAPGAARGRCPLCRCPTFSFHPEPELLEPEIRRAIEADFADWSPSQGICPQCADLYEGRWKMTFARP